MASCQSAKSRHEPSVPLELNRPGGVRQRVVGALPDHGGPEHRPPGLEGGRAVGWPALERSTLGDIREAHRPGDIARGELLPGGQHGEPWACHERIGAETRSPSPDRRSTAGPVEQLPAVAHERGGEVEIARGERVIDGRLVCVVRLVPGRGSPMEGGHRLGLAGRELAPEEVAQERVVAIRPAVVVHQQGRLCKLPQDRGRSPSLDDGIAERRGQPLEDRGAGQELDLGLGAAARGPRTAGSRRRADRSRRRSTWGLPRASGHRASRAPAGPATRRSVASGGLSCPRVAAARARAPARRPRARPSRARRDRSRAANPRLASGRTGGASVRVPRWPPAIPRAGARPAPRGCRGMTGT